MSEMPNWDGALYAKATGHHRVYDEDLLASVGLRAGMRVVDLGCGVGDLTAKIAGLVGPEGAVLGVDASASMVAQATERGVSGVRFEVGRAQELDRIVAPATIDAIVTVATLHWVPAAEQPQALAAVTRVLRPGGVFRVDMGGSGQIAAAREILDAESARLGGSGHAWFFPTEAEYADLLAGAGLRADWVRLRHQRRAMPDAAALEVWLHSQVLISYLPGLPDAATRQEFKKISAARCVASMRRPDGSYDVDYVRLDGRATRPTS
jgi:ubiquinone/menaquinone biosynthesis C-methylase UbiE